MEWNLRPSSLWEWDNLFELDHKKSPAPAPANHDFSPGAGISSGDTTASSVSASMTSSSFGDSKPFTLDGFEPVPPRAAGQPESSSSPAEPILSLKLGKRLYFKDLSAPDTAGGDADVITATKMPATSSSSGKRTKPLSCPNGVAAPPRCQVEGCNLDLSSAKDYHRKHRICEHHSKSPRVVVAGVERRFCQQCSRFHGLSEFDEKKRSCRRRLSDHNARRRKPQPEAVRLNPSRFSSIYDEPSKMNMVFDQSPRLFAAWDHSSAITTMPSESGAAKSGGHKREYTGFAAWDHAPKAVHHTKEYLSKPRPILFPGNIATTSSATMLYPNAATNKSAAPEFLNPAMEESELNTSQDFHRALSLLSANSWGSTETKPVQQHLAPLASSELWETEPANLSLPRGSGNAAASFQDLQLFRPAPADSGFYSSYHFN